MNYPMITWCIVAALLLSAFIFRAVKYYCSKRSGRGCNHKATPLFEFGRESDMFFIPGVDKIPGIADNDDDSDDQYYE